MGLSLGELAERLGAELRGGDASSEVFRVATLEGAQTGDISFFSNRRYKTQLGSTTASAVILAPSDVSLCPVAAIVLDNPYLGYARAAALLSPSPETTRGIHDTAAIADGVSLAPSACIGPHAVLEAGVVVAERAVIGPGCVVGRDSRVGAESVLVSNVSICHRVSIGARVLIHSGVVIGSDGFGLANNDGVWEKVPQLGGVTIEDDVEIGANTTIDRGALDDTIIEARVKLDNQIQIAHNVHIGADTAVAGCVAIAGSVRIGRRCTIGGASAISGHLELTDDVHITGASNVRKSIKEPGIYSSGMAVQDNKSWRRMHARLMRLEEMARRIKALEEKLRDS